jgi:hypothetical protein
MAKSPLFWILGAALLWVGIAAAYDVYQERAEFWTARAAWHQHCDRYIDPVSHHVPLDGPAASCGRDLDALVAEGRHLGILAGR